MATIVSEPDILNFVKDTGKEARFKATDMFGSYRAEREIQNTGLVTVFVFGKNCRNHGRRYLPEDFAKKFQKIEYQSAKEQNDAWHKRLMRAVGCMERSGLWTDSDLYETFKNLLLVDLADKKAIYDLYWDARTYVNGKAVYDWDKFAPYMEKYPFIFGKDENGADYVKTAYIWEKSECRLKSMYFGKYYNASAKAQIAAALKSKTKCSIRERTGYDVSFEYDPEKNMAWYSEEYKGCGNGHYYIALDENAALFIEDD